MITKNNIQKSVLYGLETAEESAALGKALLAALSGKQTVVIGFREKPVPDNAAFLKRLEPEMKFFLFEDVRNGLNYARKVLTTGECSLLILRDVLELREREDISEEDLEYLYAAHGETEMILIKQ